MKFEPPPVTIEEPEPVFAGQRCHAGSVVARERSAFQKGRKPGHDGDAIGMPHETFDLLELGDGLAPIARQTPLANDPPEQP